MKFRTMEKLAMRMEKTWMFVAWYLLPKRVVMWCFYRVLANATTGKWSSQIVPDLTWQDAADRWPGDAKAWRVKP